MAGVLVFGDVAGGEPTAASLEVAAAGAALAEALGEPLSGALVGADLAEASQQFRGGFACLYLVEGSHYRPYTAQAYLTAAQAVIQACSPSVVLFTHTLETRDWVPQLAARLNSGLVMDCTALASEGGALVVTKPVYGGAVLGEFVVRGAPRMATLRTRAFTPRPAGFSREEVTAGAPRAAGRNGRGGGRHEAPGCQDHRRRRPRHPRTG